MVLGALGVGVRDVEVWILDMNFFMVWDSESSGNYGLWVKMDDGI